MPEKVLGMSRLELRLFLKRGRSILVFPPRVRMKPTPRRVLSCTCGVLMGRSPDCPICR